MKKGKKLIALIVGVLMVVAVAITVVACNGVTPKVHVGIVNLPSSESGYRAANVRELDGIFNASNGYKVSKFNSLDNAAQITAFDGFVDAKVDYILLSANSTTGWGPSMTKANEAKIPVLLFDRMIADNSFYAAVVSDMAAEGEMAVAWLLGQPAENLTTDQAAGFKVLHIQGAPDSAAQLGRSGALDDAKDAGQLTIVKQQAASPDWDETNAKEITAAALSSYATAPFNVVYAENDGMARGAMTAIDEYNATASTKLTYGYNTSTKKNNQIIIMGFDCNKFAMENVLNGKWNYEGQCSPFQAKRLHLIIQGIEMGLGSQVLEALEADVDGIIINEETYFHSGNITQALIDQYNIG